MYKEKITNNFFRGSTFFFDVMTNDIFYGLMYAEEGYKEAKEQFDRDVLLSDDYYNGIINCRIGAPSVKSLKKQFTND